MSLLLSALLAALPNVFIGLLAPLVTTKFLTKILQRVAVYALSKAAKLTTNTIDDELVKEIETAFNTPPTSTAPPSHVPPGDKPAIDKTNDYDDNQNGVF